MKRMWLTMLLGLGACATPPEPSYSGDPAVGQQVAQNYCASCHAIGVRGDSPNPGAPPFRHLLATYDAGKLTHDLDQAVTIAHRSMPTFYFDDHHPKDLVAYLKTIQQPSRTH